MPYQLQICIANHLEKAKCDAFFKSARLAGENRSKRTIGRPVLLLGCSKRSLPLFLQLAVGEEAQTDPDDREGRELHQFEGLVEHKDT